MNKPLLKQHRKDWYLRAIQGLIDGDKRFTPDYVKTRWSKNKEIR